MFVDRVALNLRAGKGGNGVIAWRREKFIPKGGPSGGDGGKGGSVIIEASHDIYALDKYRNITHIAAENGGQGGSNRRHGRDGRDRIILVPCGTLIKDTKSGQVLHDLTEHKQQVEICRGGRGGRGNDFFKTPTNRAPYKCTNGKIGEEIDIELELKMIADVGFVGMPNAGKSTLLSSLTAHKVKIGDYPFTTLVPNLGYIQLEDYTRITFADIPGLIEGAHNNRGLGFEFLKHVERTRALIFILDASDTITSPSEAYAILKHELESYSDHLMNKPSIIALNKCECEGTDEQIAEFAKNYPDTNWIAISAKDSLHLDQLQERLQTLSTVPVECEPLLI